MTTDQWRVVTTLQGSIEENQLMAFLEANGIPARSTGEALRHTHSMTMDGLGRVEILVPPDLVDEARDLLQKVESGALRLDDED
jgi:hypothetical protein